MSSPPHGLLAERYPAVHEALAETRLVCDILLSVQTLPEPLVSLFRIHLQHTIDVLQELKIGLETIAPREGPRP